MRCFTKNGAIKVQNNWRREVCVSGVHLGLQQWVWGTFRSRQTSVIIDVEENEQSVRAGFSGLYQGLNQNQSSVKSYPEKGEKKNCSYCVPAYVKGKAGRHNLTLCLH